MKIVVLDTDTVSFGDIDFSPIDALGETVYFGHLMDQQAVIEACQGADAVLVNKTEVTEGLLSAAPTIRYVGAFATGYNNIDLEACKRHDVVFCNAPSYSTHAVAQHVFSLLLMACGNTDKYVSSVAKGDWLLSQTFSYFAYPQNEVYGKTMGIIGFGSIGQAVAKIADAMGMRVLIYSRSPKDSLYDQVSLETLLKESDFVSLHCPLNDASRNLINKDTLALMKPTAWLINTSRGPVVNEDDLAEALKDETIQGACLDVISMEPMREGNPLYGLENCYITPHIAWAPVETRQRLVSIVADNIKAFLEGHPQNQIKT